MNAILISIITGTLISTAVWFVLTIIAIFRESKREMFFFTGGLVNGLIVLVFVVVYVIYNLILISI